MKINLYRLAMAFFILLGASALFYLADYARSYFAAVRLNNAVEELYIEAAQVPSSYEPVSTESPTVATEQTHSANKSGTYGYDNAETFPEAERAGREKFRQLLAINDEFVGIVRVDGLDILLPFTQAEDNEKYLSLDFAGEASRSGTVFMSCYNDRLLTDKNIVLFGHHMAEGNMFSSLVDYRMLETVYKAPVIELDSLVGASRWVIFAAYICEPEFGYIDTTVSGEKFEELISEIKARSLFTTDVDVTRDDQILTLSTCTYEFENARFAVHARKLRDGEDMPEVNAQTNLSPKPYKYSRN